MLFSTFTQDILSTPSGLFLDCPIHGPADFVLFNLSPEILENVSISLKATFRSASLFSGNVMSSAYCRSLRLSCRTLSLRTPFMSSLFLILIARTTKTISKGLTQQPCLPPLLVVNQFDSHPPFLQRFEYLLNCFNKFCELCAYIKTIRSGHNCLFFNSVESLLKVHGEHESI